MHSDLSITETLTPRCLSMTLLILIPSRGYKGGFVRCACTRRHTSQPRMPAPSLPAHTRRHALRFQLRKMVGSEILLCIAGNKLDLERQRVVSRQDAAEYATSVGATYSETSAKLSKGIDDVFMHMGKRIAAGEGQQEAICEWHVWAHARWVDGDDR